MDVTDFATPVGHVDVSRQGNTVVMDLSVTGGFDYRYDQAQDMFIVEVSATQGANNISSIFRHG